MGTLLMCGGYLAASFGLQVAATRRANLRGNQMVIIAAVACAASVAVAAVQIRKALKTTRG